MSCRSTSGEKKSIRGSISPWPPQVGMPYPDLDMIDQTGQRFRLSSLKGKVILVTPEAMTCVGCQAWDGAHDLGSLGSIQPQAGIEAMEKVFPRFTGGISFEDPRIAVVHVLYFDFHKKPTVAENARQWAEHFHIDRSKNRIVLAGSELFHRPDYYSETYKQVCGWQVIDTRFILRSNFLCNVHSDDLYQKTLPMVATLLREEGAKKGDKL